MDILRLTQWVQKPVNACKQLLYTCHWEFMWTLQTYLREESSQVNEYSASYLFSCFFSPIASLSVSKLLTEAFQPALFNSLLLSCGLIRYWTYLWIIMTVILFCKEKWKIFWHGLSYLDFIFQQGKLSCCSHKNLGNNLID